MIRPYELLKEISMGNKNSNVIAGDSLGGVISYDFQAIRSAEASFNGFRPPNTSGLALIVFFFL